MIDGDPYQTAELDALRSQQGRWLHALRWFHKKIDMGRLAADAQSVNVRNENPSDGERMARQAACNLVNELDVATWLDQLVDALGTDSMRTAILSAGGEGDFYSLREQLEGFLSDYSLREQLEGFLSESGPIGEPPPGTVRLLALLELAGALQTSPLGDTGADGVS